jgi:hypothetical protein
MLKNIEYTELNKKNILLSTGFILLTIPIFGIFLAIMAAVQSDFTAGDFFMGALFYLVGSVTYGAIIYIPAIALCLLLELILIQRSSNEGMVLFVFVLEAIISMTILIYFFDMPMNHEMPLFMLLSIVITQLIRWSYLHSKGRLYKNVSVEIANKEGLDNGIKTNEL